MAEAFAPKMDTGRVADFTGASKGQIADKSLGTLFETVGQVAQGANKIYENQVQENIRADVTSVFEEANQPFMDGSEIPDDVSSARQRMMSLGEAYRQGKLSDTAYYGKLNTEAKRLRSKYAGREDEVDAVLREVTGVRPANQLRQAILSELAGQDKERQQAENDWSKWVSDDDNLEVLGVLDPNIYANPDAYQDPALRNQIKTKVNTIRAERAASKATIESIKNQEVIEDNDKRRAEKAFRQLASNTVNNAMQGLQNILIKQGVPEGVDPASYIQKVTSGEIQLDPQELLQLQAGINTYKVQLQNQLSQSAMDVGESNTSLYSIIGGESVNKTIKEVMTPLDRVMGLISSGDITAANIAAETNTLIKDRNISLIRSDDQVAFFEQLRTISPQLADTYYVQNRPALDNAISGMTAATITQTDKNVSQVMQFLTSTDDMSSSEVKKASKSLIDNTATILSDSKGDSETFLKVANKVFEDKDVFKYLGEKSQIEAFTALTNPKITERIVATGDKQLLNKYFKWAQNSMTSLGDIREAASDLSSIEKTGKYLSANINEQGIISLSVDSEALKSDNLTPLQKFSLRGPLKKSQERVATINKILAGMAPIIEAADLDPQEYIPLLLQNVGVDLGSRDRGWLQFVADNLGPEETQGAIKQSTEDWLNQNSPTGIPTPFDLEQSGETQPAAKPEKVSEVPKGTIDSRFQEQETLVTGEEVIAEKEAQLAQEMPTEVASGTVKNRGEIFDVISSASEKYGIDPKSMMAIAKLESSFNPKAKNPRSSAGGLFQFIDSTAKGYGLDDRFDAAKASDAAARLARDNSNAFNKRFGRSPSAGELYLMHQQGSGGALRLLSNPNKRAVDIVGRDAVRLNGGNLNMTAKEFANLWIQKAERALASL
jgi:hypothetical protein